MCLKEEIAKKTPKNEEKVLFHHDNVLSKVAHNDGKKYMNCASNCVYTLPIL